AASALIDVTARWSSSDQFSGVRWGSKVISEVLFSPPAQAGRGGRTCGGGGMTTTVDTATHPIAARPHSYRGVRTVCTRRMSQHLPESPWGVKLAGRRTMSEPGPPVRTECPHREYTLIVHGPRELR